MKPKFTSVVLVSLVLLQIFDGDFKNPSELDYIKFVLLAVSLVLCILSHIINKRRKKNVSL